MRVFSPKANSLVIQIQSDYYDSNNTHRVDVEIRLTCVYLYRVTYRVQETARKREAHDSFLITKVDHIIFYKLIIITRARRSSLNFVLLILLKYSLQIECA